MDIARERMMWRAAGCLAGVIALGFFIWCQVVYYETADMTRWPLRAGTAGAFFLLTAVCSLVAARILGALQGVSEGWRHIAWKTFSYVSIPLGVLIIGVERLRTMNIHPLTSNMKAVYIAGAFIIMAGVVGMVGERVVSHVRTSPIANQSRAKSEVVVA